MIRDYPIIVTILVVILFTNGMTLADLSELKVARGLQKAPSLKKKLISWDIGIDNCFLKSLKILVGILFAPTAL